VSGSRTSASAVGGSVITENANGQRL